MKITSRIMIVDDKPANLFSLEALLVESAVPELRNCEIVKASSGNEALKKSLQGEYAVILLDVQMPGMDGFETAELLRSNKRTSKIPIIFVTAISKEDQHVFRGYEVGAVDYLFKPIQPSIMISKVRVFCELDQKKQTIERHVKELENVQEKLRFRATHDVLTGALNRGAILEQLTLECSRAAREKKPLSLVMVDIDHFKGINDTWGHQVGDNVIKEVVARIVKGIRPYDRVGRYGGEEFLILIPGADLDASTRVCEEIREHIAGEPMVEGNISVAVTVSLGVAQLKEGGDESKLIKVADDALYRAKESGRNKVVQGTME